MIVYQNPSRDQAGYKNWNYWRDLATPIIRQVSRNHLELNEEQQAILISKEIERKFKCVITMNGSSVIKIEMDEQDFILHLLKYPVNDYSL